MMTERAAASRPSSQDRELVRACAVSTAARRGSADRPTGDHRHRPPVLSPGQVVRAWHLRPLLAVGERAQAGGRNAERREIVLRRIGAAVAQCQVVLARAALVGVALYEDDHNLYLIISSYMSGSYIFLLSIIFNTNHHQNF